MVTYSDLFTFIIMLCAVITLVINIMHKKLSGGQVYTDQRFSC